VTAQVITNRPKAPPPGAVRELAKYLSGITNSVFRELSETAWPCMNPLPHDGVKDERFAGRLVPTCRDLEKTGFFYKKKKTPCPIASSLADTGRFS